MTIWRWLFRGIGIFLVLEISSFVILGFALKKTAIELAGPYFAIAAPSSVMFFVIWQLNRRVAEGVKPQELARNWSLSVAIFFVAMAVAIYYSGAALGLMPPNSALMDLVIALLIGIPCVSWGVYKIALIRISAITGSQSQTGQR
ncbi:MAG: hypothetical protein WBD93_15855 [Acidobacteriaceae bacterium]